MPEKPFFRQLLQASTVGLNLVFSTFIGLAIGYGLDSLFKTSPWLTIIFLVIGIIAGFRELFRMAKKQDNGTDTKNT
jgi:ATP synthase protein I